MGVGVVPGFAVFHDLGIQRADLRSHELRGGPGDGTDQYHYAQHLICPRAFPRDSGGGYYPGVYGRDLFDCAVEKRSAPWEGQRSDPVSLELDEVAQAGRVRDEPGDACRKKTEASSRQDPQTVNRHIFRLNGLPGSGNDQ